MEKVSFVKNGELRLPPGFRFHPTDEELVVQYLKRKVFSFPLPASFIPEVDVCKSDPWDLPGDLEQERYFFSTKEAKYPNGNRSNRATSSGYWKATGLDKSISTSKGHQLVGMKKTLVFYKGKPPHGSRTDWIMHEYRLINNTTNSQSQMENWVLCRIFLKRRSSGSKNAEETEAISIRSSKVRNTRVVFYDFMAQDRTDLNQAPPLHPPPASSSSAISGVTEVSTNNNNNCSSNNNNNDINESDEHEESSSCNSFPYFRRKQQQQPKQQP